MNVDNGTIYRGEDAIKSAIERGDSIVEVTELQAKLAEEIAAMCVDARPRFPIRRIPETESTSNL